MSHTHPLGDTMRAVSPAITDSNPHGLGRPKSTGELASKNLTIRLTPTQHAAYAAAAKTAKLSLGDWIRAACEARLPKRRKRGG